jgi:transposase
MKFDARKISPQQQEILRRTAIALVYEEGYSFRAAAKVLKVTRQHFSKWCRLYEQGGWDALLSGKRGRPKGVGTGLEPYQCATIVRIITEKTPNQLKMPFVLWTRVAIRDLIQEKYGVLLPLTTLGDYLRRWGFTP